ncbi:MAG: DUF6273 domain-containing protein [Clostridia bacterium]
MQTTWITTQDKVFLLSEADLFGTHNGTATSDARDYTYGTSQLVTDVNMRKCDTTISAYYWLRSPRRTSGELALCAMSNGESTLAAITTSSMMALACVPLCG